MGGVLSHRSFRLLFASQSISSLGDRLAPVALAFAVLDMTGSVTDLGVVLAAQTVPIVVFVLLGGVWADRLPRRRVMLVSEFVRAASQAGSAGLGTGDRRAHVRRQRGLPRGDAGVPRFGARPRVDAP